MNWRPVGSDVKVATIRWVNLEVQRLKYGLVLRTVILLQLAQSQAWGIDLEAGGGATLYRYERLHNAPVVNLNLISQADSRFPIEWSLGYISPAQESNELVWLDNDKPTWWIGVSKRAVWNALFLGFGLVAIDQTSQRMSSNLNFKTEGGFQLGPFVAMVQHISNAGLKGSNDGETFFTCNLRFRLGR
jgi:hypothetical protein